MRNKFLGTGEKGYHPLRKIRIIASGLRFAVVSEFSVAYKMALSCVILALCVIFQEWVDFGLILIATGLVLMAELLNSAIEAICDFLETRENEKIKAIKDMAAAGVGVSIAVWLTVVAMDIIHLGSLILGG